MPMSAPALPAFSSIDLNKGIPLQSDPTVIYGIVGGKGKSWDAEFSEANYSKQTPYNTYKVKGLNSNTNSQSRPCGNRSGAQPRQDKRSVSS